MNEALIHLRVPASLKARWVRLSRENSQRLTDWIIERVERSISMATGAPDQTAEGVSAEAVAEDARGLKVAAVPRGFSHHS
ncbi:hypothetical protein [Tepidimonas charontis]|uniref:Uncharacterized protein n=1 Tax=Tepidimonas charontis TaxID=2267262 RepID=A0A554X8E3_9BURK|nr:hypothetical protein [Tepidimonas charontis]TSE32099.1 hypothetical protein Tchar_02185 [Tepidimonas charontis]